MNAFEQHLAEEKAKSTEQGIEQGIEQGAQQTALTLAKRMLIDGATLDYVANITELPLSTLHALQTETQLIS